MNSNRRVLLFVLYSVGLLFIISLVGSLAGFSWMPFKRVNLISDVYRSPSDSTANDDDTAGKIDEPIIIENKPKENFALYHQPRFITNFNADTAQSSINGFLQKLDELKHGQKRKVRIAYFGDSMIEGDLLTQTLRKLLQQMFGGNGVGFVPITSQVSKFRQTATADYSSGWQDENFKEGKTNKLYLSGHLFRSSGDWVQIRDQTIPTDSVVLEKSLICGNTSQTINVTVNGGSFPVHADNLCNRIVIAKDKSTLLKLSVANEQLPVYGVSFESESGIFVDNFSFRGITGIEFARIDSTFLSAVAQNNPYDLIIFQYGVNLLFRPNDKNFNWYAKAMLPIIRKLKHCFPSSDFIVASCADRAFRYGGAYQSAIGIDSLIKIQALLAYETGSSFYNQYESMGGRNSIVEWANMKPSLANRDYVHPNHRGAEILANYLFEAMMNEYKKYTSKLQQAQPKK
ncbi:MAG: hypothetical protein WDN26_08410 [Chitinophagaceae bacterium]